MDDPILYLKEAEPRIGIDGRKGRESQNCIQEA